MRLRVARACRNPVIAEENRRELRALYLQAKVLQRGRALVAGQYRGILDALEKVAGDLFLKRLMQISEAVDDVVAAGRCT